MYIPWESQEPCLKVLRRVRRAGINKALVVMACGIGKTATAGFDVRDFLRSCRNGRVLYLCHQNGILKKARNTFQDILGGDLSRYGFYHGFKKERNAQFLFASFQTMRDHHSSFRRDEFDYIIADEAHHTQAETYLPVLKYFCPKFLLGITATPDREDEQDIREVFGEPVFVLELPEALAKGYLTPVEYRLIADPVVELGKIENPYALSMKDLNRTIFIPRRDKEIVRIIHEKCKEEGIEDPRILAFCNSIEHAERFANHLQGSLAVHSGMHPDEQEEREEAFRDERILGLVTVDKYNEGVDIPEVNVVVFLRSTESDTIFKQQLGRGLRRAKGKKKVLVLDFVGNCERMRMIKSLEREIESFGGGGNSGGSPESTVMHYGKFVFTEQVRNVLEILEKAEAGYSTEVLIEQLQAEAKRLGRLPKSRDVKAASKIKRMATTQVFIKVFGSLKNALEAAGFSVNHHRSTDLSESTLIAQLQKEAKHLGRTPTQMDVKVASKAGRTASANAICNVFGSFNKALEASGLSTRSAPKRPPNKASLIAKLKVEAKRLGRTPTRGDVSIAAVCVKTFGSWNDALEAAGLSIIPRGYSEDVLIAQLQDEAKRLGRIPKVKDIRMATKEQRMASDITFTRVFGSHSKALEAAGLREKR